MTNVRTDGVSTREPVTGPAGRLDRALAVSTKVTGSSFRVFRILAASALSVTIALGTTALALPELADASGTTSATSSLQAQAEMIASQISADGVTLDQLSAEYNSALIHYQQLATEKAGLEASIARTATAADQALHVLKEQALLAYLAGGGPEVSFQAGQATRDPSLTLAYADVVIGGEKAAATTYRASLATEARQEKQLAANTRSAALTLADVHSAAQQAQATMSSRQQALSQVKGQLAVTVAAVEAANQQSQLRQEQATLASEGQLPTVPQGASADPSTGNTGPGNTGGVVASPPPAPSAAGHPATHTAGGATPTTAGGSATRTTTKAPATTATPATATPATATPATTTPPTTTAPATTPAPSGSFQPQASGAAAVLAYARAQLGKPYQWAGAGPSSFDCSGLVMMAWRQAGISFPHLAQDQYNLTERIPLSALQPGDLLFFGTPGNVYHVGIFVGSGQMIDAPETGQNVSVQSFYWSNLLGAGRVTANS